MEFLDYIVIAVFMTFLLGLGFWFSKKAGKSSEDFILAGRNMPWWLAGISVSATGLNASTMLQDSRKIRQDGFSGLWIFWLGNISSSFKAVFFDRLWRRARFTTQMEFYRSRYSGWQANFTRLYDSVIYGVIISAIWASVGLVGMKKIATVLLGLPETVMLFGLSMDTGIVVVVACVLITLIYSVASGVHGVVWTDFIEMGIALLCSYILLFMVLPDVGWNVGLRERIEGLGAEGERILSFVHPSGFLLLGLLLFHSMMNIGGYNPHTQRVLCLKGEKEVIYMALYNAVIMNLLRAWPFYICGLAGIFLITDGQLLADYAPLIAPGGEVVPDYEMVFPALVKHYLPVGLVGLMAAGFISAFMSSFDTNIHNAASMFLNDIYRAYVAKKESESHYVLVTRLFMVFMTIFTSVIGIVMDDILMLFFFAITISTAAGWIKILRFLWWRVNGTAEVVAQVYSFFATILVLSPVGKSAILGILAYLGMSGNDAFQVVRIYMLVIPSTVISVIAVFLTKPEPMDKLVSFYKRVRPYGAWGPVRAACHGEVEKEDSVPQLFGLALSIVVVKFSSLFAVLAVYLAYWDMFWVSILLFGASLYGTIRFLKIIYPDSDSGPGDSNDKASCQNDCSKEMEPALLREGIKS